MPAKNALKIYIENGYYHIYNRGVEKRNIFADRQDYSVFLAYLKEYLTPKNKNNLLLKLSEEGLIWEEKDKILRLLRLNNFHDQLDLLSYSLKPNHFHFLVKQKGPNVIDSFTRSLMTRYVMYFNRKNSRIGPLFQGVYKAVLITSEEQLLHLSRYIHNNPLRLAKNQKESQDLYTSLPEFLGKRRTDWVKPDDIISHFSKSNPLNSYRSFVDESEDIASLKDILIEPLE